MEKILEIIFAKVFIANPMIVTDNDKLWTHQLTLTYHTMPHYISLASGVRLQSIWPNTLQDDGLKCE